MNSSDLTKGTKCKLKVVPEKSTGNYFTVITDDGEDFQLPKIKFQKERDYIPDFLDIYVKDARDGYINLRQDLSVIIPLFYQAGKEYNFTIRGRRPGSNPGYEVEDNNGLFFTLPDAPAAMQKGRQVKCRVVKIHGSFVLLKYAGQLAREMKIPFRSIDDWLEDVNASNLKPIITSFLRNNPDFANAMSRLDNGKSDWIIAVISTFWNNITSYLTNARNSDNEQSDASHRAGSRLIEMIKVCADICLLIIEGSDFLKECNPEQRQEMQQRLSGYIEAFRQISAAASLIADGKEEEFIDNILNNLKQAGYLYHPMKQFRIMMTILRLRPELISDNKESGLTSRITALFEALHSWPVANWRREPFRSALVEQLEIFISENAGQAEAMSAGADGSDNRELIRIIRAIAIQSILAKQSDPINLTYNKTLLYRFLSYLRAEDVEPLLYKAVGAILGNNYSSDFYWDDTYRIQLLQEKASHYSDNIDDLRTLSKVFSTGQVDVEMRPHELLIRARFADEENSVLPNNTISWMNPRILLRDRVKTPAASRKNDLNAFRNMWADIEKSIFNPTEVNSTAVIRKTLPEDGDDVEIIIDDITVDTENQRLRFHCKIVDDYFYGSGWLNATHEDFLPWLDYSDYPANYDGNLEIFRAENGSFLRFPAKVMNLGPASGNNIRFVMKKHIEDFLAELPATGEVSHAVIRNILIPAESERKRGFYPHYLCLSDRGYSVKVPIEDTSKTLPRGTHVHVRYLELEHRSNANQPRFMKGEFTKIVDGPSNYGKTMPLRNLLAELGIPDESTSNDDENMEVIEAQEVMSREELLQLILMLQRRAYAEKEYIRAFNYLGLGALLARIIEDDGLYDEMKTHQDLLMLLQYYARNKHVDVEQLETLRPKVAGHAMLSKLFHKLEIVGSIARPDTNLQLWEISNNGDESEKRLASLVLSYNLLPPDGFSDSHTELLKQISAMLNVNSAEVKLKYYGEEDQYVEFKSSLIFTNKEKDHMQPKPEEQMHEILEIICGFLNSMGGKLFIGVNDLGYEAGLEQDRSYRRWKKKKDSIDSMILELERAILLKYPENVRNAVRLSSDPESSKGVIIVEVDPVRSPVALDGTYWVRNSSSTRPRIGADLTSFLQNRAENYDKWRDKLRRDAALNAADNAAEAAPSSTGAADTSATANDDGSSPAIGEDFNSAKQPAADINLIPKAASGRHRNNALHEYDPGFVHPAFYVHFNADGLCYIAHEDQYNEYDPDKLLVLAVTEQETSRFLILSYADGSVCRIPVKDVLEADSSYLCNESGRLIYADIATDRDYLLSYVKSPSGLFYARVDRVADLAECHTLRGKGKPLSDTPYEIVAQDILSEQQVMNYHEKSLELSPRTLGFQLKLKDKSEYQEAIEADLKTIFPDK
ncbi:MAG: ATP-binding protein [Muribaculum sp.]|nr:ATP-binding protein [Muribaculum sp.]